MSVYFYILTYCYQ